MFSSTLTSAFDNTKICECASPPTDPTPLPTGCNLSGALSSAGRAACQLPIVENNPSIGFIRVYYQVLLLWNAQSFCFFWLVTFSENLSSFCCSKKERKPWQKFQANYQEGGQSRNDSFAIQQLIDCTVNFPSRWNTCNLQTYVACSRNGTVEMYNSFQYHHQTVLRNAGRFGFFNIRLIRKIWWFKSHVLKKG